MSNSRASCCLPSALICGAIFWTSVIVQGADSERPESATAPSSQPAATQPASWVAKPFDKWPPMLLRNHFNLKGTLPVDGRCGFLIKLPTGPTVAVTIPTLVNGLDPSDQAENASAWTMHPITHAIPQVILRQPAIPASKAHEFHCVLMTTVRMGNWPTEVLIPRVSPLETGMKVYLVGVQEDEKKTAQTVYEGTLLALDHPTPGLIAFEFQAHVPPDSMAGAPLLDEDGHVIGIKQGWYPESTAGDRIIGQGFQIMPVIETVNIPAEPAVANRGNLSAAPTNSGGDHPPATSGTPADLQQTADQALRVARLYISAAKYDTARTKLKAIIAAYPDTPAAKEAQAQLTALEGK